MKEIEELKEILSEVAKMLVENKVKKFTPEELLDRWDEIRKDKV